MLRDFLNKTPRGQFSGDDKKLYKINLIIVAATAVFSLIMLPFLPAELPMQWNASGGVNYSLPKMIAVWVFPALMLALNLIRRKQNKITAAATATTILLALGSAAFYIYVLCAE